jgi:actin-related protein 6
VHWDAQLEVWDRIFSKEVLGVRPSETNLLMTEPFFNLPTIQSAYNQVVFEEFGFKAFCRTTGLAATVANDLL